MSSQEIHKMNATHRDKFQATNKIFWQVPFLARHNSRARWLILCFFCEQELFKNSRLAATSTQSNDEVQKKIWFSFWHFKRFWFFYPSLDEINLKNDWKQKKILSYTSYSSNKTLIQLSTRVYRLKTADIETRTIIRFGFGW